MLSKRLSTPVLFAAALLGSTTAVSAQLADLKPTQIRASSRLSPGVRATLESTIKNIGSWGSKACTSGYYLSSNTTINSSDRLLLSFSTGALGINKSATHKSSAVMPRNIPAGTCYVGVWADRTNKVSEWSNKNNTLAVKVTCYGRPNLKVNTLTSSSSRVYPGVQVSVRTEIQNDGGVRAGAFRTGIYFSADASISPSRDTLMRSYSHSGLSAGSKIGFSYWCKIPTNAKTGVNCYLGVYTDDQFKISEVTSSDNVRTRAVRCYARGTFRSYGTGCPGRSGQSRHTVSNRSGAPYIGTTTTFRVDNGPRNFVSILMLGFSGTKWGSFKLPLPLDTIGAKGCSLLVSPDLMLTVGTNATGTGTIALPHPNDAKLVGLEFFTQFANVELGFNPLGLTHSNAIASKLGQL